MFHILSYYTYMNVRMYVCVYNACLLYAKILTLMVTWVTESYQIDTSKGASRERNSETEQ